MALSLAQGVALVADQALQNRVAMGFYYQARQVMTENPATVGHELRARFARSVLSQPHDQFLQYTAMVVTDTAVVTAGPANQSAISDAQILAAVQTMWNTLANVED